MTDDSPLIDDPVERYEDLPFKPPLTVIDRINGHRVLLRKPLSSCILDNYLSVVLGVKTNGFAIWTHNAQDGGTFDGTYIDRPGGDLRTKFIQVLKEFDRRGVKTNYARIAANRLGIIDPDVTQTLKSLFPG